MNHSILVSSLFNTEKISDKVAGPFRELVSWVNKIYSEAILSPFSVTGGYEFQGIVSSPRKGTDIILAIEEYIIEEELQFKLKHVLYNQFTDSANDEKDPYETISKGILSAKTQLDTIKKAKDRFQIIDSDQLNKMMKITQHFIDGWYPKDRKTVSGFIQGRDYKEMSKIENKDSSSLWRKRKSLAIDEYLLCKEMIHHLTEDKE